MLGWRFEIKQYRRSSFSSSSEQTWRNIERETLWRYRLLFRAMRVMKKTISNEPLRFKIAATDIFVEKAQEHLTARATRKYLLAFFCTLTILVVLVTYFLVVKIDTA